MNTFQVVACQGAFWPAGDKKALNKNIDHALDMIRWGVYAFCLNDPVKLVAFGELNISGFPKPTFEDTKKLAITIPGPEAERFVELAKKLKVYIVPGSWIETDPDYDGVFFNSTFLAGPDGLLAKYRKINPVPLMEYNLSPHDLLGNGYDLNKTPAFPVVETEIGNIGMLICYDAFFPEVARQLVYEGAEILVGMTAIFYPGGDHYLDYWNSCTKVRSFENMCYGLYVNGGRSLSQFAPLSESGQSQIVDYQGRILSRIEGPGEAVTAATFNLDMLRHYRTKLMDANILCQGRMEIYDYWKEPKMKMHPELAKKHLSMHEREKLRARDQEEFYSAYYREKIEVPTRPPTWWESQGE